MGSEWRIALRNMKLALATVCLVFVACSASANPLVQNSEVEVNGPKDVGAQQMRRLVKALILDLAKIYQAVRSNQLAEKHSLANAAEDVGTKFCIPVVNICFGESEMEVLDGWVMDSMVNTDEEVGTQQICLPIIGCLG